MSDKNFKVKNKLVIAGLTNSSGVLLSSGHEVDSHTNVPTQYGGTGTTQSPTAGQVLYSSAGSTYTPTTLTSLDVKGATYSADAPASPVVGQVWIESDSSSDSFDPNIIRRKTITATAGQTTFTTDLEFIQGYEQVYFNGMLLLRTSDYTTPSNTSVVLAAAAAAGDIVEILSITNLNSINAATTTTNTFTGAQTMNQTLAINTTIQGNSRLQVNYNTTAGGYPWDNSAITIRDNRAMTTGVGGGIIFEGNYLTAGGMSAYGGIRGRKETSTSGDASGFLDIWSRSSGIRFFKSEQNVGSEGTPDMTIHSTGNVMIGTTSGAGKLRVNQSGQSTTAHFDNTNASWASDVVTSYSPNGVETSVLGISARSTGETWITSSYNTLIFRSGLNNANVAEAMRIIPGGAGNQPYIGVSTTQDGGIGGTWGRLSVRTDNNNIDGIKVVAGASDFYVRLIELNAIRSNNTGFNYISGYSSATGTADLDFYIRGDGAGFSDSTWNANGADYAEYFEWADGNPNNEDRLGYTVSLINDKIKIAEEGEIVIGVISGNPSVVGDHASNKWSGKYLKNDFGVYLRDENGDRILNPEFDPEQEYVSREDRPEWSMVGLMGKLRLRKGQLTGAGWIKMRDISETVEEWLVK